jgi:catechol 2,3-dioxygenase
LSAGGYHHHLGLNVWIGVGAPPPPPEAVGLMSFAFHVPGEGAWQGLLARLEAAGIDAEARGSFHHTLCAFIRDPDGNGVELLIEQGTWGQH